MHLGRDWLSTRSAVAGVTFMNEFARYKLWLSRDALFKGLQNFNVVKVWPVQIESPSQYQIIHSIIADVQALSLD